MTTQSGDGGPGAPRRPKSRTIYRRLSVLGVILAAVAIALAIVVPGPSGTRMAQAARGGPAPIGTSCTHYPGAEVTIAAPGPGTVVVTATVGVGINHEFGIIDEARIVVAATAADCTLNNYTSFVSVPPSLPSDPFHYETVPLLRPFSVAGGTTRTFYVNGVMAGGADASDRFDSASLVAVFYPA